MTALGKIIFSDKTSEIDEKGFSLVELLIVMAIIGTLFLLSWNAFYGLRKTMQLKQVSENMRSELRYTQRSAMFVRRSPNENWVNGVGIDLTGMLDNDGKLTYTVFKWCSSSPTYVDYDSQVLLFQSIINNGEATYGDCRGATSEFSAIESKEDVYVGGEELNFALGYNNVLPDTSSEARFIIFEAVTGFPHFFNADGQEMNMTNIDRIQIAFYLSGSSNGVEVYKNSDILLVPNVDIEGVNFNPGGNCTPDCAGRECGNDGCGGSCNVCPTGSRCESGSCESICVPNCRFRVCGPDGCGGTCATCGENETCSPTGSCVPDIVREPINPREPRPTSCFTPGTQISLANGKSEVIQNIQAGDEVLGYDFVNNEKVVSTVYEIESPIREGYYVINKGLVEVTNEHPFRVRKSFGDIGWASIEPDVTRLETNIPNLYTLKKGDFLMREDGSWIKVLSIEYVKGSVQTYNLKSVEGSNFYANGLLVHNKVTVPDPISPDPMIR